MEYIIAAMLAVAIVLLIVLLIKQGKAGSGKAKEKIDNLASTLGAGARAAKLSAICVPRRRNRSAR